jgi:hypothetical protein
MCPLLLLPFDGTLTAILCERAWVRIDSGRALALDEMMETKQQQVLAPQQHVHAC